MMPIACGKHLQHVILYPCPTRTIWLCFEGYRYCPRSDIVSPGGAEGMSHCVLRTV